MDRQTDPRKPFTTYEDSARPYIRGVELHQTRIQWCTADFHAPVRALREVMGNYLRVTAESAARPLPPQRLRLLLDTNVFIAVEPFAGSTEADLARGAVLIRLASEQGHTLLVHPATRDDLLEGRDLERRQQRLVSRF